MDGSSSSSDQGDAPPFVTATHDVLFAAGELAKCDVCGEELPDGADEEGFAIAGRGLYVWSRGGEVRYEEPPLCASCATALGVSALARAEIEEEEG